MKILFDHHLPFLLAHGGAQMQIEQTMQAVAQAGCLVEPMRWWDDRQSGDIIHHSGRPGGNYIDFAHQKGMKVVTAELHSGLASRSPTARRGQKLLMQVCQKIVPRSLLAKLAWDTYRKADAFIVNTSWEGRIIATMFDADLNKIHIVPNGVEKVFFSAPSAERGPWLVTTATITERKRVVELSQAAITARVPLWVIGKPYSQNDPYFLAFQKLAENNPEFLRYEGGISDRAQMAAIYRKARGFVLVSSSETLSLSADEAAACQCPLLLSDLDWARSAFADTATYLSLHGTATEAADGLRTFYDSAPQLVQPRTPPSWSEVGQRFAHIYATLVK